MLYNVQRRPDFVVLNGKGEFLNSCFTQLKSQKQKKKNPVQQSKIIKELPDQTQITKEHKIFRKPDIHYLKKKDML